MPLLMAERCGLAFRTLGGGDVYAWANPASDVPFFSRMWRQLAPRCSLPEKSACRAEHLLTVAP